MREGFFGISVQESYRHVTGAQWRKCSYAAGGIPRGHVNRYASCHPVYCAVPDRPQCPLISRGNPYQEAKLQGPIVLGQRNSPRADGS